MRRRYRNGLGSVGLAAIALLTVAGWLWLKNFRTPRPLRSRSPFGEADGAHGEPESQCRASHDAGGGDPSSMRPPLLPSGPIHRKAYRPV